jgi:hypothetical protein
MTFERIVPRRAGPPWTLQGVAGSLALVAAMALAIGVAAPPTLAEDPPAPPGAGAPGKPAGGDEPPTVTTPPEFPSTPEAWVAPEPHQDLRSWIAILRGQLERLRAQPRATPESTDLHEAWRSILEPRIGRMLSRLDKWGEAERWITVKRDDGTVTQLDPRQWEAFTGDVAMLATELHGALQQYRRIEIEDKPEVRPPPGTPFPGPVLSYPPVALHRNILGRQSTAAELGRWHGLTYWNLLRRFRSAWDWSWEQQARWEAWWERRREQHEQVAALRARLSATKDALSDSLLGLQAFVGALQNAEEERMRGVCLTCKSDDQTLREMAETALRDMSIARLDAERFQGESYAAYGTLLRTWLRRQLAAAGVLGVAENGPVASAPEAGGS